MKKIGIFLGFQPGVNLANEGIGRLLAFLLKENSSRSFVLYSPSWLQESITNLLADNNVPIANIEIAYLKKYPIGVRIKQFISDRKNKKKVKRERIIHERIKSFVLRIVSNLMTNYFSTSNFTFILIKSIVYLIIAVILIPFFAIFIVLYLAFLLIEKTSRLLFRGIEWTNKRNRFLTKIKKVIAIGVSGLYQKVLDSELQRLIRLINKRNEIDVCFIPSMVWPQIKNLKCKKVLASPDIVFYDFPTQFHGVSDIHKRIRKSISAADSIICYSEYVKQHHLINICGVEEEKITVIKHANVDMSEHIKVSKSIDKYLSPVLNAKEIVKTYNNLHFYPGDVLYKTDISRFDYLVYSSQFRPHKNIFNLIKAIKIINVDMQKNVKLVLTGNITYVDYIQKYIQENHLENDIFVFYDLPSEVLASINALAKCSVNPTLFEGGFPFTFSEAYSVGTPSIMSDIPVVRAEIPNRDLSEKMLFNPFSPHSIADKIVWGIENRDALYIEQAILYKKFSQRTWKQVVLEYNNVFSKTISG
ncbi:glycosyltransferase [Paenibacillus barengoltzii]|uniref:glycosyltransferase n=1 Tax=Paenibacillus barengoltzii TaxID=343517 RepID=UPI002DBC8F8F|nr:glycosyltransferase [Paenibacillus barengoltzii]MEC2346206.1 glycosyltransferase [Paenibacillus barengoltzii]